MSNKMNTPWRLGRGGYIINKRGDVIAESFANDAAHIVRCMNAHDGLVEALRETTKALKVDADPAFAHIIMVNEAALTAATGEQK